MTSLRPARVVGVVEHDVAAPFHLLHREVNRLFDDLLRHHSALPASTEQQGPLMPSIDVSETDGEVRIRAELPGVSESDIDVSLDGDVLIIRGEKKFERKDDKENYHVVERSYGTFQRALRLPWPIDSEKVSADFNNGILTVTLPKGAEPEKSRKIPVQQSAAPTSAPTSAQSDGSKPNAPSQADAKADRNTK
jgi:HSP20 family protein